MEAGGRSGSFGRTRSLDPKVILSSLAAGTSKILSATRCSVVRVDPVRHPGKAFVLTAVDDPSIEGYSLDLESYPEIEAALHESRPILVTNAPDDPIAELIRKRHHRQLPFPLSVVLPIALEESSFGVLFLRFADDAVTITPEAIALCQLVALGGALALHYSQEYAEVVSEVHEREHRARELEETHRLRTELIASASHDLRTSLHSILGYVDLLAEGAYGELTPAQREALATVASKGHSLVEFVNTLIDYARLERAQIPISVSTGEVARLLEELRITVEPLTHGRAVRLELRSEGVLPPLETDWLKLTRILQNLLHNALKFTEEGTVGLTAAADGTGVTFDVVDTGPGIPAEVLPNIFDPFFRSNPTRADGPGGLGLTIVKRTCDMLGGRILVASEVGKGSRFTVRLPLRWQGES